VKAVVALAVLGLLAAGCRRDPTEYTPAEALALLAERRIEVDEEHFIRAVRNQSLEQVRWFLAAGLDPDLRDGRALAMATASDSAELTRVLLAAGADPDRPAGSFGQTALVSAAMRGRREVIEALIEGGADPDAPSRGGATALLFATDADVARLLLEGGADPDVRDVHGATPLHGAVLLGDVELVDLLLDHGADPNLADELGRTPRLYAAIFRFGAVEERLREGGAKAVARPRVEQAKLVSYAGRYGANGEVEVEIVVDHGRLIAIQAHSHGPLYENELVPLTQTVFYRGRDPGAILFEFVVEEGRVTGMRLRQGSVTAFTPRLAD
jgi:hypothetical protein